MASERSKRRDRLACIFITKSDSVKYIIMSARDKIELEMSTTSTGQQSFCMLPALFQCQTN